MMKTRLQQDLAELSELLTLRGMRKVTVLVLFNALKHRDPFYYRALTLDRVKAELRLLYPNHLNSLKRTKYFVLGRRRAHLNRENSSDKLRPITEVKPEYYGLD